MRPNETEMGGIYKLDALEHGKYVVIRTSNQLVVLGRLEGTVRIGDCWTLTETVNRRFSCVGLRTELVYTEIP